MQYKLKNINSIYPKIINEDIFLKIITFLPETTKGSSRILNENEAVCLLIYNHLTQQKIRKSEANKFASFVLKQLNIHQNKLITKVKIKLNEFFWITFYIKDFLYILNNQHGENECHDLKQ